MITSLAHVSKTIGLAREQSTLDEMRACHATPFPVFDCTNVIFICPGKPSSTPMKKFLHSRHGASKGAALIIVLAFVVLVTALAVAHFSRTTTDRQLARTSYNDTSADLLARSALDITVSDLKQEIATDPTDNHSQYSAERAIRRGFLPTIPIWFATALEMLRRAGLRLLVRLIPRPMAGRSAVLVGTAIT